MDLVLDVRRERAQYKRADRAQGALACGVERRAMLTSREGKRAHPMLERSQA
jgi:hypothetical protein